MLLTTAEPGGANCAAGGTRITAGLDADRNQVLGVAETSATAYVCNGIDGVGGAGRAWQNAAVIESPSADSSSSPALASDANGAAVAVWVVGNSIRVNRYIPATGWGTPAVVVVAAEPVAAPKIGMDAWGTTCGNEQRRQRHRRMARKQMPPARP